MEELRSTEILDKEIQEDARKKADKIVKNSQKEAQNIIEDYEIKMASCEEMENSLTTKLDFLNEEFEKRKRELENAYELMSEEPEKDRKIFEDIYSTLIYNLHPVSLFLIIQHNILNFCC